METLWSSLPKSLQVLQRGFWGQWRGDWLNDRPSTILLLSQKTVSAQQDYKSLKSGQAGSFGSPPQLPKVANSCVQSGSDSIIIKRGALETWGQVKQWAFISKHESGSCFQNPPRSDWVETKDMLFLEYFFREPMPNKGAQTEGYEENFLFGKVQHPDTHVK